MKPVVFVPNSVLTTPATKVTSFDDKLKKLIKDMKKSLNSMVDPKGVGLAAPQIGVSLQVFITKPTSRTKIRAFVNPVITYRSDEKTNGVPERKNKLEGCLSIPKIWGKVSRATAVTLQYQDETGKKKEETFKGFMATIVQHETDHIHGTLFTQRVLEQKAKLYQIGYDEENEEVLEEISI